MHSIESMEKQVRETKKKTRSRSEKTLSKLDTLYKVLREEEDEENSEENIASASNEVK